MIVIPAIDLHGGRVVRLKRGDFREVTVYSEDPAAVARGFEESGAGRIHVVDLDGSVVGRGVNLGAVEAIRAAVRIPVELGGGIRRVEDAAYAFDLGVDYVILGTVTARNPEMASKIIRTFPGRVGIGLDALDGKVAVAGWKELTETTAIELARHYETFGPAFIVYTDISRDGMLSGVNAGATHTLARAVATPVIASGGVSGLDDIRMLAEAGSVHGVIVGKAIYEGRIDVKEAVDLARRAGQR
ncbi:MAG TPA: 1-(5-phosphoribosyl)-5-[(5-phosphoribosylamino)methylideneamino]imidazole-4-carboxamide isomerase [Deltaproteobacteria bacterium]|nr:1-(5-phosphoribosyl)-5-[(5-phosphoribosylamino)methylideneamino]imidazole-4-carboxamide isomerase [Deltaproteobacteria bacterium]